MARVGAGPPPGGASGAAPGATRGPAPIQGTRADLRAHTGRPSLYGGRPDRVLGLRLGLPCLDLASPDRRLSR
eukprot:4813879-Pyramimonas_sp.AAC.1